MTHDIPPYPLCFEPMLRDKVWGGRRLARLNKALRPEVIVGESWEIADLDATSPSGGGGDAAHSVIRNGPLAGRTIRDAMTLWGGSLLGGAESADGFPLLIKFLDAGENLSVQVHPSPAFAATHPRAHVKHEAWCVIDAEPDASIYLGLRPGVTRKELRSRIDDGTVEAALVAVPAVPGEIHHLPSGLVHALGGGVLVAEVQTPSDTTYRLFDWGRTGRELHIEQALACAFDDQGGQTVPVDARPPVSTSRVATDAFVIDRRTLQGGAMLDLSGRTRTPTIVMTLSGGAALSTSGAPVESLTLQAGDTALIPAGVDRAGLHAAEDTTVLDITIPSHTHPS